MIWPPERYEEGDLELLASLECLDCGPLVEEDGTTLISPDEALKVIAGDENGFQRCPDCGEELEQTLDAALDNMRMIIERHPDLADKVLEIVDELPST